MSRLRPWLSQSQTSTSTTHLVMVFQGLTLTHDPVQEGQVGLSAPAEAGNRQSAVLCMSSQS